MLNWLRRTDLNRRPSGYEPDELTTALLRDKSSETQYGWGKRIRTSG